MNTLFGVFYPLDVNSQQKPHRTEGSLLASQAFRLDNPEGVPYVLKLNRKLMFVHPVSQQLLTENEL